MEHILRGIIKFANTGKQDLLNQLEMVRAKVMPKAVFFSCMDSRLLPTKFTSIKTGDMFIVRNAGNMIPNEKEIDYTVQPTCEPAALELGCSIFDVEDVVICGHSDCKAIKLLYKLEEKAAYTKEKCNVSPLTSWVFKYGTESIEKLNQLKESNYKSPLIFQGETPEKQFVAYIDPDGKYNVWDKLSQINTLQQIENVASYSFLKKFLLSNKLFIHALWFDTCNGEVFYFSRKAERFVPLTESILESLLSEIQMSQSVNK